MAVSSGQVNTNVSNGNYFWVKWEQSGDQDIINNRTTINWWVGVYCARSYYTNAIRMSAVSINGSQVYPGGTYSNYSGNTTIASGSLQITHDADGKKKFTIAAFTGWLYPSNNYSADATEFELTTIPRASSITATDANIGSVSTININSITGFTHSVQYSFGNLSGYILANGSVTNTETKLSATNIGWTVPTAFFEQIPNDSNGIVTLTCKTFNGDTELGTTTTTLTANVPYSGTNNSTPVITSATAVDTNSTTLALTGSNSRLVLYKSTVQLSATGQCKNYAGFKYFRENNIYDLASTTSTSSGTTTVNGSRTYSTSTTPIFNQTQFKLYLIDTRNTPSEAKILNQANGDFTIVPYIPLTINASAKRVNPTSSSVYLSFSGNFYNGYYDASSSNFNTLTIKWRYKESPSGSWSSWTTLTRNTHYKYASGNTYYSGSGSSQAKITLSSVFNYQKSYILEVSCADRLSTVTVQKPITQGIPIHDEGIDSNGANYFNINGTIYKNNISLDGKVLYNNTTGTTGNVTLSETAANFDSLDVFLSIRDWEHYVRVFNPNGKSVNATTAQYFSDDDHMYLYVKKFTISGTTITVNYNKGQMIGGTGTAFTDTSHYIKRVIGYK